VLRVQNNGLIHTYIHFFCKYIHIIQKNTQTQYKQTCSCTQMFALCENRTRDLWRSRRVFTPLHHIGRQLRLLVHRNKHPATMQSGYFNKLYFSLSASLPCSATVGRQPISTKPHSCYRITMPISMPAYAIEHQ
jgi:hypothetical protein